MANKCEVLCQRKAVSWPVIEDEKPPFARSHFVPGKISSSRILFVSFHIYSFLVEIINFPLSFPPKVFIYLKVSILTSWCLQNIKQEAGIEEEKKQEEPSRKMGGSDLIISDPLSSNPLLDDPLSDPLSGGGLEPMMAFSEPKVTSSVCKSRRKSPPTPTVSSG